MNEVTLKSAIVIAVPEAEHLVRTWRMELDPSCIRGLPAHITLLFPFAHPSDIDAALLLELRHFFQKVAPITCSLDTTAWFDERVVYLVPNPDAPFRNLTLELMNQFPSYQPYGGKFEEPIPHLTIGDGATAHRLKQAEEVIVAKLPVTFRSDEAWLMTGGMTPNSWSVHTKFLFGPPKVTQSLSKLQA